MGEIVKEMFNFIFGGGMFDSLVKVLTANPTGTDESDKIFNAAWKLAVSAYDNFIVPIGLGLMIIWFLVAFMQKATSEQMNFDQIFLLCTKLVVAFYLMQNGLKLFADIWGLGNSLMIEFMGDSSIGDAAIDTAAKTEAWKSLTKCDSLDKLPGFWRSLGCFGQLLFPWLVAAALSGVGTFIAYSRMLEMLLRITVAPIALSDFINDGTHSAGWRYIKTFLAICLQGFVILLIARLWSAIIKGVTFSGSFMDITVGFLVISFAAVALMFKSLSFCKELVGA